MRNYAKIIITTNTENQLQSFKITLQYLIKVALPLLQWLQAHNLFLPTMGKEAKTDFTLSLNPKLRVSYALNCDHCVTNISQNKTVSHVNILLAFHKHWSQDGFCKAACHFTSYMLHL